MESKKIFKLEMTQFCDIMPYALTPLSGLAANILEK